MTRLCGPARVLAAAALATAGVGLVCAPASARITVDPPRAESGGYTTLAFSVPSDRVDVSTTKVEIRFPADHPLAGLTTEPKAGWDVTVERIQDDLDDATASRVTGVTWTASTSDAAIDPGRFELFRVSVGPLPADVDVLRFDARQTYSDGDAVSWDGAPTADDQDPGPTPAPVLALTAPASVDGGAPAASPEPTPTPTPTEAAAVSSTEPTIDAERVSAALPAEDDKAARVGFGFAVGGVLILGAVAATAFARRRAED